MDGLALGAALVAGTMAVAYAAIMRGQEDTPVWWVMTILVGGALGALYGAVRALPRRRPVLAAVGVALLGLGVLAILSIGIPILVAGVLAVLASTRG